MGTSRSGGSGGRRGGNGSKNMSSLLKGIRNGLGNLRISRTRKGTVPPAQRPSRKAKTDANTHIAQLAQIDNAGTKYNRKTEYPTNYDKDTHNNMALNWTKEGKSGQIKIDANGDLVDAKGNPVSRDQLSWFDAKGNKIDFYGSSKSGNQLTNLTYEHKTPVVDHWNTIGHNSDRRTRDAFYNDWTDMEAMGRSDNSSGGGAMKSKYSQFPGSGYTS